ncbi:unnamed protein product [Urochloa humidicola]
MCLFFYFGLLIFVTSNCDRKCHTKRVISSQNSSTKFSITLIFSSFYILHSEEIVISNSHSRIHEPEA